MLTLNLHMAQHIGRQARQCGPPSQNTEHFLERGDAKRPTKHTVSSFPEATVMHAILESEAVARLACRPLMRTFELVPKFRA